MPATRCQNSQSWPTPWSTGQGLREPSPSFSLSGEGGLAYLLSTRNDEEEVTPRPWSFLAPICVTDVLCSCIRGQEECKNAGAWWRADSAGTCKHCLFFLPSAMTPWVVMRCRRAGGCRMKEAWVRSRRLEIVGPAGNASSFRSMIQKPNFCPKPECEVGMEGGHLGQACERCHAPSLAKPKWSGTEGPDTSSF